MNDHILLLLSPTEKHCAFLREAFESAGYAVKHVVSVDHAFESVHGVIDDGKICDAVVVLPEAAASAAQLFESLYRSYPQIVRILLAERDALAVLAELTNSYLVDRLFLMPVQVDRVVAAVEALMHQQKALRQNVQYGKDIKRLKLELETVNSNLERRIKEKAEELIKVIYYDELTGLASRALLKDRLDHAIAIAKRKGKKVAFFMVGLDRFKYINDSLGQEAGDGVLREMAARISKCVRESDTVARFSGDVFGLIATDSDRVEDPGFVAQRILDSVTLPCRFGEQDVFLTCSIGIGMYPSDGETASQLLANTETAMRQAKLSDSNRFRYYSGEFNQIAGRRLSLESELRQAINHKEFVLYYQPRIDMDSHRIVGVEALLRWRHPKRGIVSPMEFLPVLEETGLIEQVGQWVLQQALQSLQRWKQLRIPNVMMAVNLSARQFHSQHLPELIKRLADESGINLLEKLLEVEITESLLMEDVAATRAMLLSLYEMGVKIAIDDFGTGYSALSYLIKFPLNYLKIDKSFVDRIHVSDDAKAIVEAIISLSYSLRLTVIAEGVETREQLDSLQSLGCKQFQGYLFANPMPEEEFVAMMQRDKGSSIIDLVPEDRLLRNSVSPEAAERERFKH